MISTKTIRKNKKVWTKRLLSCKRSCWMQQELSLDGFIQELLSLTKRDFNIKMIFTSLMIKSTKSQLKLIKLLSNIQVWVSKQVFLEAMLIWMNIGFSKMMPQRSLLRKRLRLKDSISGISLMKKNNLINYLNLLTSKALEKRNSKKVSKRSKQV